MIVLGSYGAQSQTTYVQPQPSDDNYVLARTYQEKKNNYSEVSQETDVIETIQYYDGLGRPQQNIAIGHSPLRADMVTPIQYDEYGRVIKEWMPFPAIDDGTRGNYQSGSYLMGQQFYQNKFPNDFTDLLTLQVNAYSEKKFETSPLNRLLKQGAPGKDWVIKTSGDDRAVEFSYGTNAANEVRMFAVTTVSTNNTYDPTLVFLKDDQGVDIEFYSAGELSKTISYNENHVSGKNHSIEEFTDKQGLVLLKRTYADLDIDNDAIVETEVPHDTYYVYDDHGNLTYVLTPKMDATDATLANINTNMDELGYQYIYDDRNRLVEKKIPGKDWEHIIYNDLDQPIMVQDAIQRANDEWLFTKYDVFGRVAYTGKVTDARDRDIIQQNSVNGFNNDLWVKQGNSYTFGNIDVNYNNGAYPTANITEILTISYYDDYNFDRANEPAPPTTVFDENLDSRTKGLATGSKVKVLDTNDWVTTVTRYDSNGQAVYTYSENTQLGTVDVLETDLDFVGKPIKMRTSHTRSSDIIVTIDNFEYDHVGRMLKQTQCIGDQTLGYSCDQVNVVANAVVDDSLVTESVTTTSRITISSPGPNQPVVVKGGTYKVDPNANSSGGQEELITYNDYDELGQLRAKKVGGAPGADYVGTAGLQTVNYTYNVRGWLKAINQDTEDDNDLFNFGINYNTVAHGGTALFNGNIAETEWDTANDNVQRWYHYGYDALNRIVSGTSDDGKFNLEGITYDRNGNIGKLLRMGHVVADPEIATANDYNVMDNLTYVYTGNKLMKVSDAAAVPQFGFKDGTNTGNDYTYDSNGNIKTDANKGITDITYNHLNLPTNIALNGGAISYIYTASGTKLKKSTSGGSLTNTEYAGNYIYGNGTLQFFSQPEGYVYKDGSAYKYVYQYKDHLGNIRLSYEDGNGDGDIDVTNDPMTTEIVEENNYYPFGLKHKGYNDAVSSLGNSVAKRWKYNGKELDDSFDGALATYDFGARNYDPALGRWMNIDPLAEQMRRHSPYNYAFNNPMFFVDPDGMFPFASSKMGLGPAYPTGAGPTAHVYKGGVAFADTPEPEEEALPDDIILRGKDAVTGEYRDAIVIKSEKIDVTLDVENLILPPSTQGPVKNSKNSSLNKPIELNGLDAALDLAENTLGQADALTIDIGGTVVAGEELQAMFK